MPGPGTAPVHTHPAQPGKTQDHRASCRKPLRIQEGAFPGGGEAVRIPKPLHSHGEKDAVSTHFLCSPCCRVPTRSLQSHKRRPREL